MDDLIINVNGGPENSCFSLTYYRKDHVYYCQTQVEVDDWVSAIMYTKEKYSRNFNKKFTFNLRPIEVIISILKMDSSMMINDDPGGWSLPLGSNPKPNSWLENGL